MEEAFPPGRCSSRESDAFLNLSSKLEALPFCYTGCLVLLLARLKHFPLEASPHPLAEVEKVGEKGYWVPGWSDKCDWSSLGGSPCLGELESLDFSLVFLSMKSLMARQARERKETEWSSCPILSAHCVLQWSSAHCLLQWSSRCLCSTSIFIKGLVFLESFLTPSSAKSFVQPHTTLPS